MKELVRTKDYNLGYLCGAIQAISEKVDYGTQMRKQIWQNLGDSQNFGKVMKLYQARVLSRIGISWYRYEDDHMNEDRAYINKLMNSIEFDGESRVDETEFTYGFMAFSNRHIPNRISDISSVEDECHDQELVDSDY